MPDEPKSRITNTKGRVALARWMRKNKETEGTFCKKVSVTRQAVMAWLEGITRPKPEARELVKVVTGIEPSSWDLPEDVKKRQQRLAAAMAGAKNDSESRKGAA
jgi:hypothetical protein